MARTARSPHTGAGGNRRRLSQNFLTDPSWARRVVRTAGVGPDDLVVEVGPGDGALARFLAPAVRRVIAYEVDPRLAERLSERYRDPASGVRVVRADLTRARPPRGRFHVVGNIPYARTADTVRWCLDAHGLASATLVTRLEYAQAHRRVRAVEPVDGADLAGAVVVVGRNRAGHPRGPCEPAAVAGGVRRDGGRRRSGFPSLVCPYARSPLPPPHRRGVRFADGVLRGSGALGRGGGVRGVVPRRLPGRRLRTRVLGRGRRRLHRRGRLLPRARTGGLHPGGGGAAAGTGPRVRRPAGRMRGRGTEADARGEDWPGETEAGTHGFPLWCEVPEETGSLRIVVDDGNEEMVFAGPVG